MVLIHGFTVTSTVNFAAHWAYDSGRLVAAAGPTVESALLGAGFQVVMYDLRGHGHSAKPHDPARYSTDAHAGDVQALTGHLALDRPAVVGYSLGAVARGARGIPKAILSAAAMPVLNGGTDEGAADEYDLTPFVPGRQACDSRRRGPHDRAERSAVSQRTRQLLADRGLRSAAFARARARTTSEPLSNLTAVEA